MGTLQLDSQMEETLQSPDRSKRHRIKLTQGNTTDESAV